MSCAPMLFKVIEKDGASPQSLAYGNLALGAEIARRHHEESRGPLNFSLIQYLPSETRALASAVLI